MKVSTTMKYLFSVILLLGLFTLEQKPAFTQSAGLELVLLHASGDSVVIRPRMYTPQGVSFRMWAVTVAIGYDPSVLYVTDDRGVMNHFFAGLGWDVDSRPRLDTNGIYPDISLFAQGDPSFAGLQINQNATIPLCSFTFFPKTQNQTQTSFIVVANRPTAALTGYWITTDSVNQPFNPVAELQNITIPVELASFAATQQGRAVLVQWRTESESGNHGFHVMRRPDGFTHANDGWETIGFVRGNGDSRQPLDYLFIDPNLPSEGFYEYRLKQEDYDGTYAYSPIARVFYSSDGTSFGLSDSYPNPIVGSGTTFLRFGIEERSRVRIAITNVLGQLVDEAVNFTYDPGVYTASWTPRNLPAGLYFATLTAESERTGSVKRDVVKMNVMK